MNSNPALAHISEDKARTQTVYEHLSGTADLAGEFAAPFGATEEARFAGWLHDIGKYSTAFQKRLLEDGPRVDHATAGAQEALRLCTHALLNPGDEVLLPAPCWLSYPEMVRLSLIHI